jgi:DNA-binding NtrC family response regulator/Tfp pilus assembly protein PilF
VQTRTVARCVGRDAELARLSELYAEASHHGERLVLLKGPSGVGKSLILQEFRGRVRLEGGVVLEGRCEHGRAFGPFADVVDRALRFLGEVGATPTIDPSDLACRESCHRLWHQHDEADRAPGRTAGAVADDDREALERRMGFFEAIDGLLRDVAAVRAPVLVLHDLERADRGTLQLLQFLLDGSSPWGEERPLRALIAASLRSDGGAQHGGEVGALERHGGTESIDVGRLNEEGVRAYLQSPETVARVLARTAGNPEAIELLLDADPLSPEAHLARRMDGFPADVRALFEALAVLAQPADIDLLARVAGVEPAAEARSTFGESDLVSRQIADGQILFSFARDRMRERAYEQLDEARRRALHRRCGEELATRPGQVEEAARHAIAAGDGARAVPLALEAARSLAARHAHAEAAALLERAQPEPGPALDEVRETLVELYRIAGDYRSALGHAEALRRDHPESPEAARRCGALLTLAGHLDEAADTLADAHRVALASADPTAPLEVEVLLAELHYQRASYDEAEGWADHALSAAEETGQLRLAIHARNTLGKLALSRKDAGTAAKLFEANRLASVDAELGHQEAQALTNLGVAMLRRQDLKAAESAFHRAIEVAVRASDTREQAISTENLAVLAHLKRHYADALVRYHEAVALLKRLGNRAMLARVANNLGELYLSLGEHQRALALCNFAAHMGGTALPRSVAAEGLLLRGRVEAMEGDTAAAQASFESARNMFEELREARRDDASLELARLALRDGDVGRAQSIIAKLPEPESAKRAAELALVACDLDRARGQGTLAAAKRATERAEAAGDDELLLPALLRLTRAHLDEADLGRAMGARERVAQVETRLDAHVPAESEISWVQRPVRVELSALDAQLERAAAGRRDSTPPVRHSTLPPPPPDAADPERWGDKYPDIAGRSAAIRTTLGLLDKVAPTDALVLIRGESGTGKELIAEALHDHSSRRNKPFVKVNCAALVETLLLSELFGHERGAFTGANSRKKGRFELADGGTIFLDEIGDISPKTQVALLRVLQEREFERVGGTQPIKVDVRIIAATHRDLEQMVREGHFREDLYYRLRGVMMEVPPLRRRLEDLEPLADKLLRRIGNERNEPPKSLAPDAVELLSRHRWPGNVRELENVLRSATLFADSETLRPDDFAAFADMFQLPEPEAEADPGNRASQPPEEQLYEQVRTGRSSLLEMKKNLERDLIARALSETDGNITQAASLLGMKRPRLSQLVKQYGLQPAGDKP